MSGLRASRLLSWALDALALGALALTGEVHWAVWAIAAGLWVLGRLGVRARRLPLLFGYAILIAATLAGVLLTRTPPILIAAHAAPLAHALVWIFGDDRRSRGWRLGLGFIDLILASAITSELYLPLAIILFVVLASVALSCEHLNAELSIEGDALLPKSYIRGSIGTSLLIFLTSALIFPLLPRMNSQLRGDAGPRHAETGYTEDVDLSHWLSFTGDSGGGTVLRMYPEDPSKSGDADIVSEIYLGLVRGRILDRFEHDRWSASPQSSRLGRTSSVPAPGARSIFIEAIREPLHSAILPVPYGTEAVWVETSKSVYLATQAQGEQWLDPRSSFGTARYRIQLDFDAVYAHPGMIHRKDEPLPTETQVPPEYRTPALENLARKIFSGAESDLEKIARIREFYVQSGYSAKLNPEVHRAASRLAKLRPLERFLFVEKAGHCELFASSAALLLRLAGVPTRLLAGFRLTRGSVGGMLSIRNGDAHAWLEAWTSERGWIPLDLTPRVAAPWRPWEYLRDRYDLLSAYWTRYVVGYGDHTLFKWQNNALANWAREARWDDFAGTMQTTLVEHWKLLLAALLGSILLVALAGMLLRIFFPTWFSIRWRVREGPDHLRRERRAMERLLRRTQAPGAEAALPAAASRELEAWRALYLHARFARPGERAELELSLLSRKRRAFERALRGG